MPARCSMRGRRVGATQTALRWEVYTVLADADQFAPRRIGRVLFPPGTGGSRRRWRNHGVGGRLLLNERRAAGAAGGPP